jgi:hypothetical protein
MLRVCSFVLARMNTHMQPDFMSVSSQLFILLTGHSGIRQQCSGNKAVGSIIK